MQKMTSKPDNDELLQTQILKLEEKYAGDDGQLRADLNLHGLGYLPFSAQTRKILMRKLAQKLMPQNEEPNLQTASSTQAGDGDNKTSDESVSESSSSVCSEDLNKTFYALCIPGDDDQILIEGDFLEVLRKMKEHTKKKPRMLSFSSYNDAVTFAQKTSANSVCQGSLIKSTFPKEKAELENNESVPFPSVSVPQLNAFRINLERGNMSIAHDMMASNPRYLIGTGDVPTILKAGPRYNALHASVFAGQLASCKLLMKFLCDVDYLKRMYDTKERAEKYSKRLVDLYLNTPEKMMNKTPLHFASEKGFVDIVAFLVSFKACDRQLQQAEEDPADSDATKGREFFLKSAVTPIQAACDKYYSADIETVRQTIVNLIKEATCFVPLVRSDTTGPYAKVMEPYSPSSHHCVVEEIEGHIKPVTDDLKDFSNLKVWAYAGPMSPQEAQKFKKQWWSPRGKKDVMQKSSLLNVMDGERGFEHFGRELARSYQVPWQEYWPFLDSFADFNTLKGLKRLQCFFHKQSVLLQVDQLLTQKSFLPSKPFIVSQEFVRETKDDNDSFVSADSLHERSFSEEECEGVGVDDYANGRVRKGRDDFYDCLEKVDCDKTEDKSYVSPFGKIWNGLVQLGSYLSPKKRDREYSPEKLSSKSEDYDANSNSLSSKDVRSHETGDENDSAVHRFTQNEKCFSESDDGKMGKDLVQNMAGGKDEDREKTKELLIGDDKDTEHNSRESVSGTDRLVCDEACTTVGHDNSLAHVTGDAVSSWHTTDPKHMSTPLSWTYRNSTAIEVISPDQAENLSSQTPPQSPDLKQTDKSNFTPEINQPSATSNHFPSVDNSFDRKMDSFCRTLQTFSMQSPVECSQHRDDRNEFIEYPLIDIYTAQDISVLGKLCDSCMNKQKRAVLIMKQGEGENVVCGDLYVPDADIEFTAVLDENTHKAVLGNIWTDFLVTFTSWADASRILSLEEPEILSVRVRVLVEKDKISPTREFNLMQHVESYKMNKCYTEDDIDHDCVKMEVLAVRSSALACRDVYICGSVPTKTDADVYKSLTDDAVEMMREDNSLATVNQWFGNMTLSGRDYIENLPSPSHVRRLAKHNQPHPPISPLVTHDMSASRLMDSPLTSRRQGKNAPIRNIFKDSLNDDDDNVDDGNHDEDGDDNGDFGHEKNK